MLNTVIWIIGVIAAVWVIIDVWNSKKKTEIKILWSVAAVIFSILTAIIYYFLGRK